MAKTLLEITEGLKATADKQLATVNAALKKGNTEEYLKAVANLEKTVVELNISLRRIEYRACKSSGEPFVEFAKRFSYDGIKLKKFLDPNTGDLLRWVFAKTTPRLSLEEMVEYCELDEGILRDITKVLTLLEIRENDIMKLTHEDFLKKSPYFCDVVREKESGKTPDSNRQICMAIQGIVDKMGFSKENCKKAPKILNNDMNYLQQCAFVHNSKGKCQVKPVSKKRFWSIMMDLMAHFVDDIDYAVLEKKRSDEEAAA